MQKIREAEAAGRKQRQLEARRQREELAIGVMEYKIAQEEWHQQRQLKASHSLTNVTDPTPPKTMKKFCEQMEQDVRQVFAH